MESEDPKYKEYYTTKLKEFERNLASIEGGKQMITALKQQQEVIKWLGMVYKELRSMKGVARKKKVFQ